MVSLGARAPAKKLVIVGRLVRELREGKEAVDGWALDGAVERSLEATEITEEGIVEDCEVG